MADGGRADSRTKERQFSAWELEQLEQAAARLCRLFWTGGGEMEVPGTSETHVSFGIAEDDQGGHSEGYMGVMRFGRVTREAAWDEEGKGRKSRSTGMHEMVKQGASVAMPATVPRVEAMAALSFAKLTRPQLDLLMIYCREDWPAWLRVEPVLHRSLPTPNRLRACRDAMARVMFNDQTREARGRAHSRPVSIEQRARELRVRAGDYRAEVLGAMEFIRCNLVCAAERVNAATDYRIPPPGQSQGRGFAVPSMWWRKDEERR